MNDTLFDMPEAKEPPLRLRANKPVYNWRRIQNGQNLKVNLRDCRTGKVVATIYGGERMAAQIVAAVNEKQETMMGRGDCAKMRESITPKSDPDWKDICAKCKEGDIEPKHCEYYGEPNGCNSPIYGEHPTAENSSVVGNAAKLREALEATLDLFWDIHNANRSPQSNQAYAVIKQIKAALAAPPRNCDVGTAKEQSQRFDAFCDAHKYVGDDGANWCSRTCPCYNDINCGVNWAQMPYESEVGK